MRNLSRSDRALTLGFVVLLVLVGVISFDRARRERYDFHHFYLDARYVWEHGALNPDFDNPDPDLNRQLPFYLPVVPLVLAPLTALGHLPAALLWAAAQVATLGYSLRVLRRWASGRDPLGPAAAAMGMATILAIPAFIEAARFNQVSYFVLALVLGALSALDRDRPRLAGVLFGAAAVLKLLPAIFLPWLLLKRRWSAAATMIITTVVLNIGPTYSIFGPQRAAAYHSEWWQYNVRGAAAQGMLNPELADHFLDRRNESIAQVIARLTWTEHPYAAPWQPLHLSEHAGLAVARVITIILAIALLVATATPWRALSPPRRHAEAAVYALGMLVFAPLLRQYYLVWAFPALALLARAAVSPRSPRIRRLGWLGLAVWLVGMLAWIWPVTRVYGAHLVMLIVMGFLVLRITQVLPPASSIKLTSSTRAGSG